MIEATSCGGVVIFRGKILVLYKNYKNKYEGWVLPKGTVEAGEEYKETALREVKEETNLDVDDLELYSVSDDIQPDRHYITLHIIAKKHSGELKVMEPTKEDEWQWFNLDNLPEKLYTPSKKFIEEYVGKMKK